ncbi:MAG: segregation/condensation protein A [Defluviitaleaceae bacterium]|nr:segregation/condensation protein A [Defluviitaleaceae bacterium]
MELTFKTEAFEGPLDLLLNLIEKNRINLYDIPIALLTDQYLEAIAGLPGDMDSLSSFIVMASTLLEIKSKMLLPLPPKQAGEEEADPRDELVRRLQEYARIKEAAKLLSAMSDGGGKRLYRLPDAGLFAALRIPEPSGVGDILDGLDEERLFAAFLDVMNRCEGRTDKVRAGFNSVEKDSYTIDEQIGVIGGMMAKTGKTSLTKVFAGCRCKMEKIVTFLALLELIRQRRVRIMQKSVFEDIVIQKAY